MNIIKPALLTALCALSAALPIRAAAPTSAEECRALWEQGNAAYGEGDYATAKSRYKEIIDGDFCWFRLYYNYANACFKSGALGEAILYYKRAARLKPGNDDVYYNLEIAEAQTKDKIAEVPEFFLARALRTMRNTLDCTAWSVISLVAFAAMVVCLLLFLLASRIGVRKGGFYGCAAAALLFALATWCAAAQRHDLLAGDEAVVMQSAISVKSSPDNAATDIFVLHEGTTVRILTEVDGWYEIVIADGKKGWAQGSSVERI